MTGAAVFTAFVLTVAAAAVLGGLAATFVIGSVHHLAWRSRGHRYHFWPGACTQMLFPPR